MSRQTASNAPFARLLRPFKPVTRVASNNPPSRKVSTGLFDSGNLNDDFAIDEEEAVPLLIPDGGLKRSAPNQEAVNKRAATNDLAEDSGPAAIMRSAQGVLVAAQSQQNSEDFSARSLSSLPEKAGIVLNDKEATNDVVTEDEVVIAETELALNDEASTSFNANQASRNKIVPKAHQIGVIQRNICPICEVDWTDHSGRTKREVIRWTPCTIPGFADALYIDEQCHNSWHAKSGLNKDRFGNHAAGALAFAQYRRQGAQRGTYSALRARKADEVAHAQGSTDCPTCPESKLGQNVQRWCEIKVPGLEGLAGFGSFCRPCYSQWYNASRKKGEMKEKARRWCRARNGRCRQLVDSRPELWR